MARILIMHPDRTARKALEKQAGSSHEVQSVADVRAAAKALAKKRPGVVVAGLNGKKTEAFELLRQMQQSPSRVPVIMVATGRAGSYQSTAMKYGAADFLEYPFEPHTFQEAVAKALTGSYTEKGGQPPLTREELTANLTELEQDLNRRMQCFAGKNQVFLQSFILGGGRKSKPRIALKCPLRQEYGMQPNVYYEYVRDVCCGNPGACPAYQTFKAKHPDETRV